MDDVRLLSLETYRRAAEFHRIGNRAVKKAQDESRRRRIPNVYSHSGTLYYEQLDGHLTTTDPLGSAAQVKGT